MINKRKITNISQFKKGDFVISYRKERPDEICSVGVVFSIGATLVTEWVIFDYYDSYYPPEFCEYGNTLLKDYETFVME